MTRDLETTVRKSVEAEPHDLVLSTEEGRYLVLVLPLPGEEDGFDHPWKKTFLEWLQKGRTVETAAHLAESALATSTAIGTPMSYSATLGTE